MLLQHAQLSIRLLAVFQFWKLLVFLSIQLHQSCLVNRLAESSHHQIHHILCLFTLLLNDVSDLESFGLDEICKHENAVR